MKTLKNKSMNKNNWQVKYLKDLCIGTGEYGLNSPAVPLSPKLPLYLRITDITDTGNYFEKNRASVVYNKTEKLLHDNDFLFARTGATVGKTYLYKDIYKKVAFAGYLIRFTPDIQKINPYFLALYCQTNNYWNWVRICSMRSGQQGISAKEYGKLPIPYPPIKEQQKIVEVLESWDKAIGLTKQLIEQKELQKKYLMQQLLTGRTRLKGFNGRWENAKLGTILEEVSKRNTKLTITQVLSVTNNRGFVRPEEHFAKNVASENLSNYKIINRGEFAYNPSRINVGSIAFLEAFEQGVLSPMYVVFKCFPCIASTYFKHWIKTKEFNKRVSSAAQGSVRSTVDFSSLSTIKINYPTDLQEQQAIAGIISFADKEIYLLKQKLAKLEEQKKGLMQVLLTGKVRLVK